MSDLNDAVRAIVEHKVNLIICSKKYEKYIEEVLRKKDVLKKHGIADSEETMKALVKAFRMGAADAMIYDIGAALDFTKQKRSVHDWTSYRNRQDILTRFFCES
ncbi:MAG: hypothetical protein ACYSWQ_21820 [Planctomycetota bacterium]|jgi:hypothetical protein